MQEPLLFKDSIKNNIRYGQPDATDEEVRIAAEAANALHFIESNIEDISTEQKLEKMQALSTERIKVLSSTYTNMG